MTIGHKIKKVRELKNYTQEHLADRLGMSIAGYGKIERDEVDLSFSRLDQIANALGVKTEDLVSFDERVVFNINNNKIHGGQFGLNYFPEKMQQLYEEQIQLLKDKVRLLEEKLENK